MNITSLEQLKSEIQSNIYRIDRSLEGFRLQYLEGELTRTECNHLLVKLTAEKYGYQHSLEMVESLIADQKEKDLISNFFDNFTQGAIPKPDDAVLGGNK